MAVTYKFTQKSVRNYNSALNFEFVDTKQSIADCAQNYIALTQV
jgi:hypothetical protein